VEWPGPVSAGAKMGHQGIKHKILFGSAQMVELMHNDGKKLEHSTNGSALGSGM
jgi:hypothetical protein